MCLSTLVRQLTPQLKKAFHDIEVASFGPRAVTDMYYISHIGIVPTAQGKGLGGLCLEYMVNRGKEEGKNVSLLTMTPRHVSGLKSAWRRGKSWHKGDGQGGMACGEGGKECDRKGVLGRRKGGWAGAAVKRVGGEERDRGRGV